MRDVAKIVLRGKCLALREYIRKEWSQLNELSFHLKKLEKEQIKAKISRRKEIKIRAEINETENRKQQRKINETKSCILLKD